MGERQHLQDLGNLSIMLCWGDWVPWNAIARRDIPDKPGVYEAKFKNQEKRLHIGETSRSLKERVWPFIRGQKGHSTGERIETDRRSGRIDVNRIVVRWAITDCYDTKLAEAWLQRLHRDEFDGMFPAYDKDPCHKD